MPDKANVRLTRRDSTIDIVRGIAIVTMVGANMAPLLFEPHSLFLRYYSTFAAPIFVTLAGSMIAFAACLKARRHGLAYFAQRGAFLIGLAALLDIIAWKFLPFIGVDVLYLIGLSMPLLYLATKKERFFSLAVALLIFALTPILQGLIGYAEVPLTPSLSENFFSLDPAVVARHWVIDGWFPLFPWLGYGLIGVFIGKWRWDDAQEIRLFSKPKALAAAGALIILGAVSMHYFSGPLYSRLGYSELFYPATLGFIALSLGVVVGLIAIIDFLSEFRIWGAFRVFGEASLFMYLVHSLVIGLIFEPFWPKMTTQSYLFAYTGLLVFLWVCGHILRGVRTSYKEMPVIVKWVIGG